MEKHLLQLKTVYLFSENQVLDYKSRDTPHVDSMQYTSSHLIREVPSMATSVLIKLLFSSTSNT
jgi:hypothetical protein